jgi:hypothetical protein
LDQNQAARFWFPLWKAKGWTKPFQLLLFEQIFCKRTGSRFNLEYVKDANGNAMSYTINHTMMRINLATPMKPNSTISFSIKWWYNIMIIKRWRPFRFEFFEKKETDVCNCSILS